MQSRYYDPEVGRFINSDSYTSTGQGVLGNNMFAYCNNSPVTYTDPSGHWASNDITNPNPMSRYDAISGEGGGGGVVFWEFGRVLETAKEALVNLGSQLYSIACGSIGAELIAIGGVVSVVYQTAQICLSRERESRNELYIAQSFARAISSPNDKYVVHHIVAKADTRALQAQEVLNSVGIDPWTAGINLAVIPESMHTSMHTNSYFKYINSRFRDLHGKKLAIIMTLSELQFEIQFYAQTGFKMW